MPCLCSYPLVDELSFPLSRDVLNPAFCIEQDSSTIRWLPCNQDMPASNLNMSTVYTDWDVPWFTSVHSDEWWQYSETGTVVPFLLLSDSKHSVPNKYLLLVFSTDFRGVVAILTGFEWRSSIRVTAPYKEPYPFQFTNHNKPTIQIYKTYEVVPCLTKHYAMKVYGW